MSEIISGYHNTAQILNPGTPDVTITGTIKANGSFATGNPNYTPLYTAVYGPSTGNFTITNLGTVDETFTATTDQTVVGIVLGAPGTLSNSGFIYGNSDGVLASGGTIDNKGLLAGSYDGVRLASSGLVENTGTIEATTTHTSLGDWHGGVRLSYGGSVNNSGLITSDQFGIVGVYDPVSITNSGTIEGAGGTFTFRGTVEASSGVVLLEGGSVTNTSTRLISGQDGIVIEGSAGTAGAISNAGSVIGTLIGVAATAFTSIDNSGLIEGTSTTLVTFAGESFAGIGVDLAAGGSVTNQSIGTITGAEDGIAFSTYAPLPTNVNNSGLIEATGSTFVTSGVTFGAAGVFLIDGGTLTNQSTGTIIGYAAGVQSFFHLSAAGENARNAQVATSIINSGLIESGVSDTVFLGGGATGTSGGVVLDGGGALTNTSTGRISGNFGVYMNGGSTSFANYVDNLGSIDGVVTAGVILGQHASLANSGLITGAHYGVFGFAGNSLTNQSGGIVTGSVEGVLLTDGGEVLNNSGGTIVSADIGIIGVYSANSIDNFGLIEGTITTLVTLSGYTIAGIGISTAGGSVTNHSTGTISGEGVGIVATSSFGAATTIDNSGVIETLRTQIISGGQTLDPGGISMLGGGTLTNEASGRVLSFDGVYLTSGTTGNTSYLDNLGSIIASGQTGVVLGASASMSNGGDISSAHYGVSLLDGNTVTNQSGGVISGGDIGIVATDTIGVGSTIFNSGDISGGGVGVFLNAGGKVANSSGGVISGFYGIDATDSASSTLHINNEGNITGALGGIKLTGGRGYITNSGTLDATGSTFTINGTVEVATGINLLTGGTITNTSSGLITGKYGIEIDGGISASAVIANAGSIIGTYFGININAPATITNSGFIEATSDQRFENIFGGSFGGAGINLNSGGTIINEAGGTIIGYNGINTNGTSASVINFGYITGENAYSAIYLNAGGNVTNYGTIHTNATLNGPAVGMVINGTVTNASTGLMKGGAGVYFKTTGAFSNSGRVIVESSAFDALGIATLTNSGLMESTSPTNVFAGHTYISAGANLTAGGVVTNAGTILSSNAGIISYGAPTSIYNSGTIEATGTALVFVVNPTAGTLTLAPVGIALLNGGSVTNTASGLITGSDGIYIKGSAASSGAISNAGDIIGTFAGIGSTIFTSITNSGLIAATDTTLVTFSGKTFAGTGIDLVAGGAVTNQPGGTISGPDVAVFIETGTVNNSGLIEGTGHTFAFNNSTYGSGGVFFNAGGTLTNQVGGTIIGFATGVQNALTGSGPITVDNSGLIEATGTTFSVNGVTAFGDGVALLGGGRMTNEASGRISGYQGVYISGGTASVASYLDNAGSINGSDNVGVVLGHSANMVNSGQVTGHIAGISVLADTEVTNQSGALISGATVGAYISTGGTLTNAGTITGSDGLAVYFATSSTGEAIIDPGAVFSGTVYDAAGNGVLDLAAAAANGTLSGLGSEYIGFSHITIDSGANWTLASSALAAGQTLTDYGALTIEGAFTNNGVVATDPSKITFTGGITGTGSIIVAHESNIVFDGSVAATQTIMFADSTGTITLNDPSQFHATVIGEGTTIIACFAEGTHILTPRGDVAVEDLAVGDLVITSEGEDAPIKWIGRRTLDLTRHPNPKKAQPIRIDAGALGDDTPTRDLILSPDHGLYIENHLVPVKALLNYTIITQLKRRSVTYYHIELEEHAIIFAEGAAVETYLETGNRGAFENGDVLTLHPDFAGTDYQVMREALSCAPFVEHGPLVDNIRIGILSRVYRRLAG